MGAYCRLDCTNDRESVLLPFSGHGADHTNLAPRSLPCGAPVTRASLVSATSVVGPCLRANTSSPATLPLRTSAPTRPAMRPAPARLVRRPRAWPPRPPSPSPPRPPPIPCSRPSGPLCPPGLPVISRTTGGAPAASSASALAPDLPSLLAGLLAAALARLLASGSSVAGPPPLPAAATHVLGAGAAGAATPSALPLRIDHTPVTIIIYLVTRYIVAI